MFLLLLNRILCICLLVQTLFCNFKVTCHTETKSDNKETESTEETNVEWRVLGKDETVPRGSHVQIDLTTGVRKIKIVKSDSDEKQKTSIIPVSDVEDIPNDNSEDLKSRLSHIVSDDVQNPSTNEKIDGAQKKFKSYDELKKEFEDLRVTVKTDIEVMNSIVQKYKDLENDKLQDAEKSELERINMLTDLEYLLHQIDNANEFVKNGGINEVILPSLNSTLPEVRSGTARLLGSAAQSNIAVQIAALESGAIGMLLRILALDNSPSVRSSAMYALSCVIRQFPTAQKKFVDEGGLTVLNNLFFSEGSDKIKIQIKIISLVNDLIIEKQDALKTFSLISAETNDNASNLIYAEAKERIRQYNVIGLEKRLLENHWCEQLSKVIIEHTSDHLDVIVRDISYLNEPSIEKISVEHDFIETVLKAMMTSSNLCRSDFENNKKLLKVVSVLKLWYHKLSSLDEDDDGYFKQIFVILGNLSWNYDIRISDKLKDEL